MIDVSEIERAVAALDSLKGEEKLQAARRAYANVQEAEYEIAMNPAVPVDVVWKIRKLIPEVQATVNRLEAGQRKREANKAAKA